jgi:hypothetical protein
VNDKIIDMVRRTPGIKTGQIADQLDVDFEEAERLCNALVLANRLTGELVPLTGGGKVMAYHLLGQLRMQTKIATELPAAPAPAADVPKFLQAGTKEPEAPAKEKRAYNRRTPAPSPPTTDAGIRQVLGLEPASEGGAQASPVVEKQEVTTTERFIPAGASPALTGKIIAPPPKTRCCMWSDGILEIQRDGMSHTFDTAEQMLLAKAMGFEV